MVTSSTERRSKKWRILRHSLLLLVKDYWNILLILFVWYMKAEPGKKKHIFVYIRLIFVSFYHTTNLRLLLLAPIHFDHISFVFLNTPLVSLIHKVGWFYVLGSRVLLCLFSLESEEFQKQ